MDIKSRKIKRYLALSILLILCFIMASAITFFIPRNTTTALTSTASATKAGNGTDLWISSVNQFNGDVFLDLTDKIFGTKDWKTYIQDNYDTGEFSDANYGTGSYVVPATTINASANIDTNNGMVVNLGGLEWMVTSLTLAEGTEDVVLTLLLANPSASETSQYSDHSGSKGANMYSCSVIRQSLLNSDTFKMFSSGNFATNYLVQPENIKYQKYQSVPSRGISAGVTGTAKIHPNDALKEPTHGSWDSNSFKFTEGDEYYDYVYEAWGEDRIWLPSIPEMGNGNSIWKLTTNQKKIGTASWLRSGGRADYTNSYHVKTDGSITYTKLSTKEAIRPAIHLNLTKASQNITIPTITKPTKTEDIKKYWIKDTDVQFDLAGVYMSDPYVTNASDWVDVTITGKGMVDGNGTRPDVEIKNIDGQPKKWTVDTAHKLTFGTQTVATYDVKIKPKDGYYWSDGSNGEKTVATYTLKYLVTQLDWQSNNSAQYNGKTQYFEVLNYDTVYKDYLKVTPALVQIPTDQGFSNAGKWAVGVKDFTSNAQNNNKNKVKVELLDTTLMEWADKSNPAVASSTPTAPIETMEYSITKKKLTINLIGSDPWSIAVNSTSSTKDVYIDVCEEDIEIANPVSFEMYYKKDETGATENRIGTASPKFEVDPDTNEVVTPKKVRLTLTMPNTSTQGSYKYILKLASGVTVNDNYTLVAGNTSANASVEVNDFKIEPKKIDIKETDIIWRYTNTKLSRDTYTVVDKSDTTKYDAVNKIYNVDYNGGEYEFSVDTSKLDSDGKYDVVNGTVVGTKANGKTSVKKATNVKLDSNGDVDYYEVILTIKVKDGLSGIEVVTDNFTLKYRINKALFDLSDVTWDYDSKKPKEYNKGLDIKVELKGLDDLPVKLEANYSNGTNVEKAVCSIDPTTQEYIPYTAKVSFKKLSADIENNYKLPVQSDRTSYICKDEQGNDKGFPWELEWIIKKAELDLDGEWEKVATEDKNNVVFRVSKITDATLSARIEYEYYAEADWDEINGVAKGMPIKLENIVVDLNNPPVKYWAVAKVNALNDKNYEIKKGTEARLFTVGASTVINVDLDKNKDLVYDGNPHGLISELKFDDTNPDLTDAIADVIVKKYYLVETDENGQEIKTELKAEDLPKGAPTKAGKYIVSIDFNNEKFQDNFALSKYNISFEIKQAELTIALDGNKNEFTFNDKDLELKLKLSCDDNKLDVSNVKIVKKYYSVEIDEDGKEIRTLLADGVLPKNVGKYIVVLSIDKTDEDNYRNYKIKDTCIEFDIEIIQAELEISLNEKEYTYDGEDKPADLSIKCDNGADLSKINFIKTYYKGDAIKADGSNRLADGVLPKDAGKYIVVISIDDKDKNYSNYKIKDGCTQFEIVINKSQITAKWDTTGDTPKLSGTTDEENEIFEYVYTDNDGNEYELSELQAGKTYTVVARIKSEYADNYEFVNAKGNVLKIPTETEQSFEIKSDEPTTEEPQQPATSFDISKIVEVFKEWWQLIASVISILLMLIFISKTIGYENKRKANKKTIDKKYSTFYGITLFGLTTMTWTLIACVLMGGALLTFVIMLVAKSKYKKSNVEVEDAKEEYERNQKEMEGKRHDEQLQMMLMGMLGGNANGQNGGGQSFVYQQPSLGADDIRGIVADTMNNMLPNVTQYLPQEASHNDELIQQLIDQNAQNEERMQRMMQQLAEQNNKSGINEDTIERLVEKLSTQQVIEKQAEKEVASSIVNDETISNLNKSMEELKDIVAQMAIVNAKNSSVERVDVNKNDDKIEALVKANESLMRNQEMLMKQIVELSNKGGDKSSPVVVPIMPQPTVVQQPVMPQPIYQQPMYQQPIMPPTEKVVERIVEKPVEKFVPVPMSVEKPAKESKAPAQRLTLDEAYAKLSATQKKIFDTLKAYAMSKDKCKEKKSTYFTVLGQSTVNPLVKLTIKKNTTVAMFKMEDEYFKDIRRGASSDGTKVKVKETEVVVGDNQALATAKDMIDLREDQIERYNDFLKEQKSLRKK